MSFYLARLLFKAVWLTRAALDSAEERARKLPTRTNKAAATRALKAHCDAETELWEMMHACWRNTGAFACCGW